MGCGASNLAKPVDRTSANAPTSTGDVNTAEQQTPCAAASVHGDVKDVLVASERRVNDLLAEVQRLRAELSSFPDANTGTACPLSQSVAEPTVHAAKPAQRIGKRPSLLKQLSVRGTVHDELKLRLEDQGGLDKTAVRDFLVTSGIELGDKELDDLFESCDVNKDAGPHTMLLLYFKCL